MQYNISWVYLLGVFIITIIVLFIYISNNKNHEEEIKKIEIIEEKINAKKKELDQIRAKTSPCKYKGLNDPRSCYFKSHYSCTWNEEAERCNAK